jgi:beta-carotene 3-hydroxylase
MHHKNTEKEGGKSFGMLINKKKYIQDAIKKSKTQYAQ